VDRSELAMITTTATFGLERFEDGLGGEIARVEHEVSLADSSQGAIGEAVVGSAVGIGENGDHDLTDADQAYESTNYLPVAV
jgi:hypothetical protein